MLATIPSAATTSAQECDRLAAHPTDRGEALAGVKFDQIRADEAIRACRSAVAAHPSMPRYADQLGRALHAAKRDAAALRWYHKAAEAGHLRAILYLTIVYSSSSSYEIKGVAKDDAKAVHWMRKAAEKGNVNAMRELGTAYYRGEWVKPDRRKALEWFLKAEQSAKKPDKRAIKNFRRYMLAHAHHHGYGGVARDDNVAAAYMLEALNGGQDFAIKEMTTNWRSWSKPFRRELQRLLRVEGVYVGPIDGKFGAGTKGAIIALAEKSQATPRSEPRTAKAPQSPIPAIEISSQTAASLVKDAGAGGVHAMLMVGSLHSGLFSIEGDGSWKDDNKAEYWYRKVAEKGNADAMFRLASLYHLRGNNNAEAINWYRKGAKKDHLPSMLMLGKMLLEGSTAARNEGEALRWVRMAAEKGNQLAGYKLAEMYRKGQGATRNSIKAEHWYRKSAEKGWAPAMYDLARMFIRGEGVPVKTGEGVRWFLQAGAKGHPLAMFELGEMYLYGRSVPKDLVEAKSWLEKAARKGHSGAMYSLGFMYDRDMGTERNSRLAASWMIKALEQLSLRAANQLISEWEMWSLEFRQSFQLQLRFKDVYEGATSGEFGQDTVDAIKMLVAQCDLLTRCHPIAD